MEQKTKLRNGMDGITSSSPIAIPSLACYGGTFFFYHIYKPYTKILLAISVQITSDSDSSLALVTYLPSIHQLPFKKNVVPTFAS